MDAIPPEVHVQKETHDVSAAKAAPASAKPKDAVDAAERKSAAPMPAPAPAPKSGFLPLALGGLAAGVIGFAVATFTAPAADTSLATQVAAQSNTIAALSDRIANQRGPDLSGIEASIAELTARIAELEARPQVVAAPAGENVDVSADMDALRAQIAEMTNAAQTELEEARAAAASIEANAVAAARNAAGRAALARVQTALESGAPLGATLADLEEAIGVTAPDELVAAQDGIPTLASLQDSFPDAARAALATARSEGVAGEETTGLGAFFRTQFDVRSTAPREGDGADAVLSRAEAAIRIGRLSDALAELSAVPEIGRAEMSDWLAQAELRAGAVAAVDILSSTLSDN
ncbi:COG4223 family protein [Yoonia sp.]|uniref:COG4223 family protein n=1 Tax=Yoonia sp. TaxID=2212373 RepID=UPI0035C879B5